MQYLNIQKLPHMGREIAHAMLCAKKTSHNLQKATQYLSSQEKGQKKLTGTYFSSFIFQDSSGGGKNQTMAEGIFK